MVSNVNDVYKYKKPKNTKKHTINKNKKKHSKKKGQKHKHRSNIKQFGGGFFDIEIPQETENDDGYGIAIADIFSDPNVINEFPRPTHCDCIEGRFIPNFFKLTQLNYIQNGLPIPSRGYFLLSPTTEMFTFSHMIKPGEAFYNPEFGYSTDMFNGPWINKYIKWLLYNCISSLYVTGPSLLGHTRLGRVLNISTLQGDSDVTIRYIFDKYNWETLKILHTFPGVGLPNTRGGPFVKMCQDDLISGLPDWPTETYTDKMIRKYIIKVWTDFIEKAVDFDNYADQYAYLWWLAGGLGLDAEGVDLFYPKVYGIVKQRPDTTIEGLYFLTSRVQFMLYEFPFWRQINGGDNGVPPFYIHGDGTAKPEDAVSTPSGAGLIVQMVRYFTLIQKDYSFREPFAYNKNDRTKWRIVFSEIPFPSSGELIEETVHKTIAKEGDFIKVRAPLVVHYRDGHACCSNHHSAFFENEWLKTPYRYLAGTSIHYTTTWHEYRKGWFAGFFSAKKDETDTTIMPLYQWKQTFGRTFCLQANDRHPNGYVSVCPPRMMGKGGDVMVMNGDGFVEDTSLISKVDEWGYGIDEYVGGWMLIDSKGLAGWQDGVEPYCKEIFDNTIYVQIMWFHHFLYIPSRLLILLNIKESVLIDGQEYHLWQNYIYPIINETNGERHNNLVGDIDLRGILCNGSRIGQDLNLPIFLHPSIVAFFLKLGACQRLLFDTFYYIGNYSIFRGKTPSWADVKTYMYNVSDKIAGLDKMNTDTPIDLEPYMRGTHIDQKHFAVLVHLIPPIYAYFYTLFNNSELATNFSEHQEYRASASEADTYYYVNTFINNVLTPSTDDATFVFYYKKLYNFYGCVNSVRKHGPKRDYTDLTQFTDADKDTYRETLTDSDPSCMGWDMRQWYRPALNVHVGITENLQSLTFNLL